MREDYTDVTVVLDRSGSMSSIREDMEGGFNEFIEKQKALPGEMRVSLYQFDTEYERVYAGLGVKDLPKLKLEPRGGTALLDALGRAIDETGSRLRAMPEAERPAKVVLLVITDGEENSSRERTAEQVKKLVQQQENEWRWQFVYLGANVDAFAAGASIGVSAGKSAGYGATGQCVNAMYHNLAGKFAAYRCAASNSAAEATALDFDEEDRVAQGEVAK